MNTLLQIFLATMMSSTIAIFLAGMISFHFLEKHLPKMICISAGLLLTVAFTHLLPEAFEDHDIGTSIGWTLLVSVLILFSVEHYFTEHQQHHHHNHHCSEDIEQLIERSQKGKGKGGEAILLGDAFHNFSDGILIASSFMVSSSLGWVTALAIMAHEIPQEVGDFMVLLHAGFRRGKAFILNVISGLSAVVGGVLGYFLLDELNWIIPYAFAVAGASFIYIALSDLMPEITKKGRSQFVMQLSFIMVGVIIAYLVTGSGHAH